MSNWELDWAATRKDGVKDSKKRFSNRVGDYTRYRPGYPREIMVFLNQSCGLTDDSVVADVGSGTGLLTALFLENGNRVFAVEPNPRMREAAEHLLGTHPLFESVAGSAEATTLPDASVDLVAIGNALHWTDPGPARAEFSRILKPSGHVAIVWNAPVKSGTPFLEAFARFLSRHGTHGKAGENTPYKDLYEISEAFFPAGEVEIATFPNAHRLDLVALEGLVLSFSNLPARDEPGARRMLNDLKRIFLAKETDGTVTLPYEARVYIGGPR